MTAPEATAPEVTALPDRTALPNRLWERLVTAAAAEDLLDVAWRDLDTAVGPLRIAATPLGVVKIAFTGPGLETPDEVLAALAARVSPRILRAPGRLDGVAREIEDYLAGRRHEFEVPLDLQLSGGFRRLVLDRLCRVGYGQTISYGGLARSAGNSGAARAVGTACATNPLPLVIPCHRVVRSDGSVGNYAGGAAVKSWLLGMEKSTR